MKPRGLLAALIVLVALGGVWVGPVCGASSSALGARWLPPPRPVTVATPIATPPAATRSSLRRAMRTLLEGGAGAPSRYLRVVTAVPLSPRWQ